MYKFIIYLHFPQILIIEQLIIIMLLHIMYDNDIILKLENSKVIIDHLFFR